MSAAALDSIEVKARNVFGRPVGNTRVTVDEKRAGGSTHLLATIEADGYMPARAVLDFNGRAEVLLLADPDEQRWPELEDAGRKLIAHVLRHTYVAGADVLGYTLGLVHAQPDRVYYIVREKLLEDLEQSAAFERANADMHAPPPGFEWGEPLASYKGLERKAAAQLTMWAGNVAGVPGLEAGKYTVLEADVDLSKGVRHALDALLIHPITGQPDPRIVAQLVTLYRGLPLPWRHHL